jgi:bacillithiol system protein YtxJ
MEWIKLERTEQLEDILASSESSVIFKHSTRCHISSMALAEFNRNWAVPSEKAKIYLLDLIAFRSLSDEIAVRTKVVHQSPQVIVLQNGELIYTASHHSINADEIEAKIG